MSFVYDDESVSLPPRILFRTARGKERQENRCIEYFIVRERISGQNI